MRLYSVTNMYTAGIHAGIQTAHAVHEMFRKPMLTGQRAVLEDWADNHKTIIVLSGGYHANIRTVAEQFSRLGKAMSLPNAHFCESEDALAGAYTAAVIVVPESIWGLPKIMDQSDFMSTNALERELAQILSSYPLAK